MWILHETHEVRGRHEDAFETAIRDRWLPALAALQGVRLLAFLKHAHGTGASYRVVTLTALRDGAAFEGLARATRDGALAPLADALDALRHDVVAKLLEPLPWSPFQTLDPGAVPATPQAHAPALFMEDTVWPHEDAFAAYLEASGAHYAREMEARERESASILRVEAGLRTTAGSGRRREVVLWQRVVRPEMLVPLVTREVPDRYRQPGTWMHDALALRDQWESRLLRRAPWSPVP